MKIFDYYKQFPKKNSHNINNVYKYYHLSELNERGHIFYKEKLAITSSYAIYRVNNFNKSIDIEQFIFFYLSDFDLY